MASHSNEKWGGKCNNHIGFFKLDTLHSGLLVEHLVVARMARDLNSDLPLEEERIMLYRIPSLAALAREDFIELNPG
jgi:hypothetical protein